MGYILLFLSIGLGVTSQILIKWRINGKYAQANIPDAIFGKMAWFAGHVFLDPVLVFSIMITFFAGVAWMATMTKLDISFAYPFTALGYVFVLLISAFFLGETLNSYKVAGVALICAGIFISCRA